jgi:hypothetical protein
LVFYILFTLLEKLIGSQLVKKFSASYGIRMFITALTSTRHLSLCWARSSQSMISHPTSWRSILILSSNLLLGICKVRTPSKYIQAGFLVVNYPGLNLCFLSLDPRDSHCPCPIGFTFTTVICPAVLTAFTLCFVLYSSRVTICVLFPAIVENAKISHQLSGHICTYVTHLSNTKIVGSRPCTVWNISADMSVSVHASG